MIILSLTKDGLCKVKRKGDVVTVLPQGGMIVGIPVMVSKPQAYFKSETEKAPNCKSNDGVTGRGDIGGGNGTRECSKCPMNQWSSDPKGGKGKACKQTVLLALSCAGTAKMHHAETKRDYYLVSDKAPADHTWWYEAYDLPTGSTWQDDYKHPGPVILRMTASSFAPWQKALGDVGRLHETGKWPLEATVWCIEWKIETQKSGHEVGVWTFKVASITEPLKWQMVEAIGLKDHESIANMSEGGHESEGIITPERATAPTGTDDEDIPY